MEKNSLIRFEKNSSWRRKWSDRRNSIYSLIHSFSGVCWNHYEYNGGLLLPHKGETGHFKESELALIL